ALACRSFGVTENAQPVLYVVKHFHGTSLSNRAHGAACRWAAVVPTSVYRPEQRLHLNRQSAQISITDKEGTSEVVEDTCARRRLVNVDKSPPLPRRPDALAKKTRWDHERADHTARCIVLDVHLQNIAHVAIVDRFPAEHPAQWLRPR